MFFFLLACSGEPPPVDTTGEDTDTTGEDTGSAIDPQYADGITLLSLDTETHADFGYQIATYGVTKDYAVSITTPQQDGTPRFHILSPAASTEARPVLVIMHGGAMDVDTKIPIGEKGRCTSAHGASFGEDYAANHQTGQLAARLGWVVIIPENSFCDAWVGMGGEDPYDTRHGGFALTTAAINYLRDGQDAVSSGDDLVLMGHSAGGRGATFFTVRSPAVSALIFDSGTSDVVRYYYEDGYTRNELRYLQDCLDHNLGGPPYDDKSTQAPSEFWPGYLDLGLVQALEGERLSVPVFHLHNSQDGTSPPIQHEDVPELLAAREAADGTPWFTFDANHSIPGHPQLPKSWSAGYSALQFAQGAQVAILEAESGKGDVGELVVENVMLNNAGVSASEAGTLVSIDLPAEATGSVSVVPVLFTDEAASGTLATVTLTDGISTTSVLLSAEVMPQAGDTIAVIARYIEDARLTLKSTGALTVTVELTGAGTVAADAFLIDW